MGTKIAMHKIPNALCLSPRVRILKHRTIATRRNRKQKQHVFCRSPVQTLFQSFARDLDLPRDERPTIIRYSIVEFTGLVQVQMSPQWRTLRRHSNRRLDVQHCTLRSRRSRPHRIVRATFGYCVRGGVTFTTRTRHRACTLYMPNGRPLSLRHAGQTAHGRNINRTLASALTHHGV